MRIFHVFIILLIHYYVYSTDFWKANGDGVEKSLQSERGKVVSA